MSWYGSVGIVTDLMTLGGGGGALNTPSSFWGFVSLLPADTLGFCGKEKKTLLGSPGVGIVWHKSYVQIG